MVVVIVHLKRVRQVRDLWLLIFGVVASHPGNSWFMHVIMYGERIALQKSYNGSMSEKTFTLGRGNLLLPILESLLRQGDGRKDGHSHHGEGVPGPTATAFF